jgi:GT2 family glycosyltransferase
MSYINNKDITVVVILYKTPLKKIINLIEFKNFKLIILDQGSPYNSKKKIQKIINFKFKYYFFKKNLGLSKGINFLIKKTKTKYCLITEPDIFIKEKSVINLKKLITKNKNFLLVGPRFNKKEIKKSYKITKSIDLSCVLFETKKIIKFNLYDEDFFFFWTDIDLIKRINKSHFKMAISKNSFAKHLMSSSSKEVMRVNFIRDKSYKYGELIFDDKYNNLRFIKILRQLIQSFFKIFFHLIVFNKNLVIKNFGYLLGIIEFLFYILKKKFF